MTISHQSGCYGDTERLGDRKYAKGFLAILRGTEIRELNKRKQNWMIKSNYDSVSVGRFASERELKFELGTQYMYLIPGVACVDTLGKMLQNISN